MSETKAQVKIAIYCQITGRSFKGQKYGKRRQNIVYLLFFVFCTVIFGVLATTISLVLELVPALRLQLLILAWRIVPC